MNYQQQREFLSVRAQLQDAQRLIREGKHKQAKAALKRIQHPQARQMEKRLNDQLAQQQKGKQRSQRWKQGLLAFLLIILLMTGIWLMWDNSRASSLVAQRRACAEQQMTAAALGGAPESC